MQENTIYYLNKRFIYYYFGLSADGDMQLEIFGDDGPIDVDNPKYMALMDMIKDQIDSYKTYHNITKNKYWD